MTYKWLSSIIRCTEHILGCFEDNWNAWLHWSWPLSTDSLLLICCAASKSWADSMNRSADCSQCKAWADQWKSSKCAEFNNSLQRSSLDCIVITWGGSNASSTLLISSAIAAYCLDSQPQWLAVNARGGLKGGCRNKPMWALNCWRASGTLCWWRSRVTICRLS